jgi:two-component system response regulator PilR (NtrC family)
MKPQLLVVDDERSMREFLEILLTREGYEVNSAASGSQACDLLDEKGIYDLVITDIKMPRVTGLDVLRKAKSVNPDMQVIMITAFASHETAVEAMKEGAFDYITKPFKVDEIRHVVANALEKRFLSRENIALKQQLGERYGFENLIGSDPRMLEVFQLIERVAATPTNILILGETGTGKELVARAVHAHSPRRNGSFVVINCGAIPGELLESELFGHRRGSFTGAVSDKKGLFEIADGGTIFFDEVAELPLPLQVKLLRTLQEKKILPVGDTNERKVDARVVSATNRNLEKEVEEGRFRQDLYYRLNVIQVAMPPLRERAADIPLLADFFLEKYSKLLAKPVRKISSEALMLLKSYNYPGNVRELENIIERAVALEMSEIILPESLPPHILKRGLDISRLRSQLSIPPEGINLDQILEEIERDFILQALKITRGAKKAAGELLGVSFRSFRYRLEKLGLEEPSENETEE